MASIFAKTVGAVLVPLLGFVVCPPAGAQGSPDQSIEFLETLEIADTLADEEEREISIPKPDTPTLVPTLVPLSDLMGTTIPKNPIVPQVRSEFMRDSIADRKGLWKSVRTTTPVERRISFAEPDIVRVVPFNRLLVTAVPKTPVVPQVGSQLMRDSIADRKGLRKTVRLIKSERPRYPQVARRQGWEGTVVLRITIGAGGNVENVATQKSTGHDALDESAAQSVKTWRFDPAKDGEFPVPSVVDLPIRFNLDEYGIQSSREEPEPEPEPEPVKVKKPARLVKSARPDYPKTARQQGWEGTVMLRMTIGTGGDVEDVTIKESSGFSELDESAAQSVKSWQFEPAKLGDDPISSAVDLPVRFDLEEYNKQEGPGTAE